MIKGVRLKNGLTPLIFNLKELNQEESHLSHIKLVV